MDYMALKARNKALNLEEARAGRTDLKSRPLYFWFDIYGPCNLKCVHCGFQKFGRTSEEEVSERVYNEVISELMPTAYVCNLGGTNWGEMTISKNFHRFLLDAKKYQVKISLTTNGTKMLDQWFDDLLDTLTVIGFSMEGIEEQFERIRGFKWSSFLKNVEKVCQGRADRGKDFKVEWRYCAHVDSVSQLPQMIRLAKSVGVDRIQVMNFVPYVAEQKYKALFYHRALANHYFAEARKIARDLDFEVSIPSDFDTGSFAPPVVKLHLSRARAEEETAAAAVCSSNGNGTGNGNGNGHGRGNGNGSDTGRDRGLELVNCFRPWQATVVGELGDVKPCCVYWKSMGNLQESGFEAVWNGAKYRRLRATVNRKSDAICYGCRMPQFDSEENRAAAQLAPSVKELVVGVAKSLVHRPAVRYTGVMDEQYDPHVVIM